MKNNSVGINEIASITSVSPRTIRDWRREKFNITKNAINKINDSLKHPESINVDGLVEKWQKMRSDLNRIGGIAHYKKYGDFGTIEGRRKGGSKALSILRSRGIIPLCKHFLLPRKFSVELAEFVGILLGDGGITKEQVTVTLNSEADKQYAGYVSNLGNKLFSDKPTVSKRKNCKAIDIRFSGKQLVEYLVKNGLKVGDKVRQQVGVPDWIQNSKSYTKMCLRGLMDTDGGVFTHKYKVNGKQYAYRKICFSNRSLPLLHFVFQTLMEMGFSPKLVDKVENKKVWLYNTHEVDKYLSFVKSSNERLSKHNL